VLAGYFKVAKRNALEEIKIKLHIVFTLIYYFFRGRGRLACNDEEAERAGPGQGPCDVAAR
jgi:hypothetical protein